MRCIMKKQYVVHTYKEILTIVVLGALCALSITACGKSPLNTSNLSSGACQNLISTGNWFDPTLPDTMVLNANCAGTTTYCNEKFTYQIQADNVTVILTVTQTNGGPQCNAMGVNMCTVGFTTNNTLMQLTCSFGTYQYQRQ